MIKQAIRSRLPDSLVRFQDEFRGRRALDRTQRKVFDASNLRALQRIDLREVWSNADAMASWVEDHGVIGRIFGEGEYNLAVSPSCRQAMYFLIMALRPTRVLEIGTNVGGSALYIARALKRIGANARLETVDIVDVNHPQDGPWVAFGLAKSPAAYARDLHLDNIAFHVRSSRAFLDESRAPYDLIFLDGDHAPAVVYAEICAALKLLTRNGVILLHDYYPDGQPLRPGRPALKGPFLAVERIRREHPEIGVLPLGRLPWEDRNPNVTSLAVLGRAMTVD